METTETKNTIQTATKESAESARKVGAKLRALAGNAAGSSRIWAKRFGEMFSDGARFTTLQANHRVLRTRLDRAHRELGRVVYATHEKGEHASHFAEPPEHQAALQRVEEAKAALVSNAAELAELRKTGNRGDSASS
jgi:hypothetical protein